MKEKIKTILVVEDESTMIRALTSEFSRNNISVLQATNGEDGLKIALEKHPDLIVLDIIMPKMDGMMMLKKLRADDWGKSANVIILTNLTDPGKVKEASEEKVYDFWIKADWHLSDLTKAIKEKIK
ncbi:response regulator [Patescibacteria group bacterium]